MYQNSSYLILTISCLFYMGALHSCPFTITNDSKNQIIIVNPHKMQMVRIKPGKTMVIDPTLEGIRRFFRPETLDIYVEYTEKPDSFYRKYRFIEKYCVTDLNKNKLTFSDIKQLANRPT